MARIKRILLRLAVGFFIFFHGDLLLSYLFDREQWPLSKIYVMVLLITVFVYAYEIYTERVEGSER